MKINRTFIKGTNWALAGLISMLGFSGCERSGLLEYGTPNADYTVKGTVVNKADGKPIEGIRVGYSPEPTIIPLYGVISTPYTPKTSVTTNAKGEFTLTENTFPVSDQTLPVYVEDIDGEKNGLFQSDTLQVDFNNAKQTKKSDSWYEGEFTVTVNVELTEIKNQ